MKKITPDELLEIIEESGLNQTQVYEAVGVTKSWYFKMMNGGFKVPNQKWMSLMAGYCKHYMRMKKLYDIHCC